MNEKQTKEVPFVDSHPNTRLILDYIKSWGPDWKSFQDNFSNLLADDVIYENSGFPTFYSKESSMEALRAAHKVSGLVRMEDEIRSAFSSGPYVFVDRIEQWFDADDKPLLLTPMPVGGVFMLRNGKIAIYRDYFDPGIIRAAFAGSLFGY